MKQKLFLMLIALAALTPFGLSARDFAYTYEGQTITYTVINEEAKICATKAGYVDPNGVRVAGNVISGSLALPSNPIDGDSEYTLVHLNEYSFYNCDELVSVTIPETVSVIFPHSFSGCSSLVSISIPESVTNILYSAFQGCSSLTSIRLPESLTKISSTMFQYCTSLTSIHIPEKVTDIEFAAFDNCISLTSIQIPETVTLIKNGAFSNCNALTSITLPESISAIEEGVFSGCSSLTYIKLPKSVCVIGKHAFFNCTELTSIDIPESIVEIEDYAFSQCTNLSSITIPNTVVKIGSGAFKDCSELSSLKIPETIGSIASSTFSGCTNLSSIEIPETVNEIGDYAFSSCNSLTSIIIPKSVTQIGTQTFYNCKNLSSIVIPETLTIIGDYSFYGCSSLSHVKLPKFLTHIGTQAFYDCTNLTSVNIPISVSSIDQYAFWGCPSLKSVFYEGKINPLKDPSTVFMKNNKGLKVYVPGDAIAEFGNFEGVAPVYATISSLGVEQNSVEVEAGASIEVPLVLVPAENTDPDYTIEYSVEGVVNASVVDGHLTVNGLKKGNVELTVTSAQPGVEPIKFQVNVREAEKPLGPGEFTYTYEGQTIIYKVLDEDAKTCSTKEGYFESDSTITGNNISGSLILPGNPNDGEKDYTLVKIANLSFINCDKLVSVSIPETVTKVGDGAFHGCRDLSLITIPESASVTEFGVNAFRDCISLTSIILPQSLIKIEAQAFTGCINLSSIALPPSVTEIGINAFEDCRNLTSIILPVSLTKISFNTFSGCNSLSTIDLPESLVEIGSQAFRGCSNLESINIPQSVTEIGSSAFMNCDHLSTIQLPKGIKTIAPQTFLGCSSLTSVSIPQSVTEIGASAFLNCSRLTSIQLPEQLLNIAPQTFWGCSSLTSVSIPQSVTGIGKCAFFNCTRLPSLIIPDNVTQISSQVFSGCRDLISINIPVGVTEIGEGAFVDCKNLKSIFIPEHITQIREGTFSGCHALSSIVLPKTLTEIGVAAFQNCRSLKSINIPESVTEIGICAFEECTELSSISIPQSVLEIKPGTFSMCTGLTTVFFEGNTNPIADPTTVFVENNPDLKVYVPENAIGAFANFEGVAPVYATITSLGIEKNAVEIEAGASTVVPLVIAPAENTDPDYTIEYSVEGVVNASVIDGKLTVNGLKSGSVELTITSAQPGVEPVMIQINVSDAVEPLGPGEFRYTYEGQTITYTVLDEDAKTCATKSGYFDAKTGLWVDGNIISGSLTLPSNPKNGDIEYILKQLGEYAFNKCSDLTSIIIPESVTSIGDFAFSDCSSLTSINIPESVTSIGSSAFNGCSSLTSINIPHSITSIGEWTFYWCSSLISIIIPEAVTSIEDDAFGWCKSLTSVVFEGTTNPVVAPASVFKKTNSSLKVYVPGEAIAEFANLEGIAKVYATITSFGVGDFDVEAGTEVSVPLLITPVENTDSDFIAVSDDEETATVTIENGILSINGLKRGKTEVSITSAQPNLEPLVIPIYVAPSFDLDGSGSVNVGDVVNMVGKVITKTTDPERQDLTGDDRVDVSDIVRLVAHILRGGLSKNTPSRSGALSEVPEWFEMSGGYTAMQTDVVLADGARIEDVAINPAIARSHTLAYNEIEPGRYRVIVYSPGNRVMNVEADEPLFTLAVTGNDIVETEATMFVEAEVIPTGIDSIADGADVESVTYFDLQGRRVSAEAKGVLIERTVLTDGTIVNRKIRK